MPKRSRVVFRGVGGTPQFCKAEDARHLALGETPNPQGNPDKKLPKRSVDITVHKATCLRQSLGACVAPAWKAAINADIDRIGVIVWFSSRGPT